MRREVLVFTLVVFTVAVLLPFLDGRAFRFSSRSIKPRRTSVTRTSTTARRTSGGWWRSSSSKTNKAKKVGGSVGLAVAAGVGTNIALNRALSKTIKLSNGKTVKVKSPPETQNMMPFFYGKQSWMCLNFGRRRKRAIQYKQIGKKSNTWRSPISTSHRVLMFRGLVFDFENALRGNKARIRKITSMKKNHCKITWENINKPSGWSGVSEKCIRKCVASWKVKHWDTRKYVFWWHKGSRNSNTFTRKVAEILWDNLDCPGWCG